jgi:hypothetical protein
LTPMFFFFIRWHLCLLNNASNTLFLNHSFYRLKFIWVIPNWQRIICFGVTHMNFNRY